jgi:hypothetical protein
MPRIPRSIATLVQQQTAVPIPKIYKEDPGDRYSPYASYWYKAVAGMLLSGRVSPRIDDNPNRTDVNRICKEANFNQYVFERIANFLVAAKVITAERESRYVQGPNQIAFWRHDVPKLQTMTRQAVLSFVQKHTGYQVWRPTMVHHSRLIEFLTLFFGCFRGLALPEQNLGAVFPRMWPNYWIIPRPPQRLPGTLAGPV